MQEAGFGPGALDHRRQPRHRRRHRPAGGAARLRGGRQLRQQRGRRPTRWCARSAPAAAAPSRCRPTSATRRRCSRMFEQVDAQLGRLDGAGQQRRRGRRAGAGRRDERRRGSSACSRINVIGSFVCAREAVRRMSTRHGGARRRHRQPVQRRGAPGLARASTSTTRPARARSTASPSAWPRRWRPRASASTRCGPGLIDTEIHASGGLPDRARELAPTVPMQRAGTRRGGGRRDRLAAVGRGQLHHRPRSSTSPGGR